MNSSVVHFISLNVRGLRDMRKRSKIFLWLIQQKSDIVFLQETYWSSDLEPIIRNEWKGQCFFNHGTNHSKGVAILIKENTYIEKLSSHSKRDGRILNLSFTCQGESFQCINVYAPTKRSEKDLFYKNVMSWIKNVVSPKEKIIFGGDWNYAQNKNLDTQGILYAYGSYDYILKLKKQYFLLDIWRKFYPKCRQYTWRQNSRKLFSRLDYWLISRDLSQYVYSTDIRPCVNSDHNAISLKLKLINEKRGRGYWKFNSELLKDEVYRINIEYVINKVKTEYKELENQGKWEMCKARIKEFTIKYAVEVQRKRKENIVQLEKEYFTLSKEMDHSTNDRIAEKMNIIKKDIDTWYDHKCKGAYIRSREKWMEEGEKSTKYFLGLEKRNGKRKEVDCLESKGKTITDKEKILYKLHGYYYNLYKNRDVKNDFEYEYYLHNIDIQRLNDNEALSCEGDVTEKECAEALARMNNNKSPGSDGLTVEFYKCFWSKIKDMLINSLNEGHRKQQLSPSQNMAVLALLFKKGNKNSLHNWRPISILNVDYKILAQVLSKRLQTVVTSIVSLDQTGFIKDRSSAENIRLVQDLIDYYQGVKAPGIIMFLDFEKAYDNVSHNFLFYLLKKLNFGKSFIQWIQSMYTKAKGRVMNHGWISESFNIERGVRQGCPLSSLLFIIVAEVLAMKIKQNNRIKGLGLPMSHVINDQVEIKISQFADDAPIFVNNEDSFSFVMEEIMLFGTNAGPKINLEKTNLLKLNIEIDHIQIECTESPIKYLGIYVGKNEKEVEKYNWQDKLDKIQNIIRVWKLRNLTFYGKVVIIKTLLVSQIVYPAKVIRVPQTFIKSLNKIIYSFIWNSKKEKVKRNVCINRPNHGGLGMVHLESKIQSLKIAWISRLLEESERSWKFLF